MKRARRDQRVVIFAPGLSEIGGAARHSRLITQGLAARGWDVKVVTRAGTLRRFILERSRNLTVIEVPGFGHRWLGVALFLIIAVPLGLFWGLKSRLFIAIQLFSQTSVASVCGFFLRKPVVAFGTASGVAGEFRWIADSRAGSLRRFFLRYPALLIAQSAEMAGEFRYLTAPNRIMVINNPVQEVEDPGLNGEARALFTGRLAHGKNLDLLLDAWIHIVREFPNSQLTLLGTGGAYGSREKELKARVARDSILSASVSFPGWVEDIAPYMKASDIFVLPSLSEGMSNSLVEAVAWRRIIVASNIPPNTEVLGNDYPFLFPPDDREALAAALREALTNEDVRSAALKRISDCAPRFDQENVLNRIESAISRVTSLN